MKIPAIPDYSIEDVINYRSITWPESKDFLYLTEVPLAFEKDFVKPDYYCFGMISRGKLEIIINNQLCPLSKRSLMIYRPGELWKVSEIEEGTKGNFVLFTRKFLDSLNENIFSVKSRSFLSRGIRPLVELNKQDGKKIRSLFRDIFAVLGHLSGSTWELVARNLASALIYETDALLSGYIKADHIINNREDELFSQFNHLLGIQFKNQRKPEFYASQLCVTPNYLYAVVKKISGETPTGLISKCVINEAKYQVGYTLNSFTRIAGELNFVDQFTFSKYFKKMTGYSPTDYRKHANAAGAAVEI